ncbi:MAG TPA: hypothetical protein VMT58_05515, partial [Candidatus Binataceae bacterium]|nr:hypothetical protein [Candidatus Binataceae bacterium]
PAFSIWVILAMLLGPGWTGYGVMLLIPLTLIASAALRGEPIRPAIVWLAAITYGLATFPPIVFYGLHFHHFVVWTGYAQFLLLGFIATLWFAMESKTE